MNNREPSRERHLFSKAAAIMMLGAGALTACTNVVDCTPIPESSRPATEAPAAKAPETHLFDINDVLQGTETAPRSPRNDTARCVFAASQIALTKFMHDPTAKIEHRSDTLDVYSSTDANSGKSFSIVVHTDTPGSATISLESTISGQFSLRGEYTIPFSGDIDESLAAVNPVNLRDDYEIADRSGVFNLQTGEGEVVKKSLSDDIAAANCGIASDFVHYLG